MMTFILARAGQPEKAGAANEAANQAQSGSGGGDLHSTAEAVSNMFGRMDALAHPEELISSMSQLPTVLAAVFVAVGLVCLLQGFKLYRWMVIIIALMTGLVVGYKLGGSVKSEMIVGTCLGVLMAVLAWPLMKYAVAVAGGLAGAFIGANAWVGLASALAKRGMTDINPDMHWVGALVGLMFFGLLSFIVFELSVVVFTSFSGSVLTVLGALALLLQVESIRSSIATHLTEKPFILPLLVMVPAVIGLIIQQQAGGMKKSKPKGASGGGDKTAVAA